MTTFHRSLPLTLSVSRQPMTTHTHRHGHGSSSNSSNSLSLPRKATPLFTSSTLLLSAPLPGARMPVDHGGGGTNTNHDNNNDDDDFTSHTSTLDSVIDDYTGDIDIYHDAVQDTPELSPLSLVNDDQHHRQNSPYTPNTSISIKGGGDSTPRVAHFNDIDDNKLEIDSKSKSSPMDEMLDETPRSSCEYAAIDSWTKMVLTCPLFPNYPAPLHPTMSHLYHPHVPSHER